MLRSGGPQTSTAVTTAPTASASTKPAQLPFRAQRRGRSGTARRSAVRVCRRPNTPRRTFLLNIGSTRPEIQPQQGSPPWVMFFVEGEAAPMVRVPGGARRRGRGSTSEGNDFGRRREHDAPTPAADRGAEV